MRQAQLLGYFGIFFGILAAAGIILVFPTPICAAIGITLGVKAVRREQRVVGYISIGLNVLAVLVLLSVFGFFWGT